MESGIDRPFPADLHPALEDVREEVAWNQTQRTLPICAFKVGMTFSTAGLDLIVASRQASVSVRS